MGDKIESKAQLFSKSGRRWAIALSIVGLLATSATAIYSLKLTKGQLSEPPPSTIQTPAIEAVTALGRLEPEGEVIRLAPPPTLGGAKIIQLLVKEGDRVEVDQVIALLHNHDLRLADVKHAQKEIEVAQANLAIVKAGAKTGEINAQKAAIDRWLAQLRGQIATNQAKIARLEAELQGEILAQGATIDRLEAELGNAQREFQRYQKLAQDGAISDSDLDQRRLNLETSRERVKEAKATFKRTEDTLTEEIREARAIAQETADTLEKQIQEAKATLNRIAEVREVDVQQAQAEVERAMAALKQAQADLELTYVKAPMRSQVLKIHAYPGESVNTEEGIAELGQTDQMMVVAEVYESDIGKVSLGQQTTITSESGAFEGELQGKVSQIGLQIGKKDVLDTDPAADVDVRVVEVKILLNPEDSRRVSGLTYAKVLVKIFL
ncbi:MAG: ABC exporter membrane fusion protein [Xenococcaceae cyanobacterium]